MIHDTEKSRSGKPVILLFLLNLMLFITPDLTAQEKLAAVDIPPKLKDGRSIISMLYEGLVFPDSISPAQIDTEGLLEFTIDTAGVITTVIITDSLGLGNDERMQQIILSTSGKWNPGRLNGKPVEVLYSVPVSIEVHK